MRYILFIIFFFQSNQAIAKNKNLNLEVQKVRNNNLSYQDFCNRWQGECDLSGPQKVILSTKIKQMVSTINLQVNTHIEFQYDKDQYEKEEFWNYPVSMAGDCEDNALEKRRLLVNLGIPRGSLRMATAFHNEKFYAHALLLFETSDGTFVLDQDSDEILLWYNSPYIFESRERTDGQWDRFYQDW